VTGFGSIAGVAMDGAVATAANNYCGNCQVTFVTYGFNVTENVQYAGTSPGLIDGLMQINVMIPSQPVSYQTPTPQLQVKLSLPGSSMPVFLGFIWVSQRSEVP